MSESRTVRYVLFSEIVLTPFLALLAPLGLATLVWVGGALLLTDAGLRRELTAKSPPAFFMFLAALAVWGLISAAWAEYPAQSFSTGSRLLLLILVALLHFAALRTLEEARRQQMVRWMAFAGLGFLLAVTLAAGEQSPLVRLFHIFDPQNLDDDKSRFNRGIAAYAVLCFSYALAWVHYRHLAAGAVFGLASAAVLIGGMSMAVPLAMAVGLLVGASAWKFRQPSAYAAYGALLVFLLLLPQFFSALFSLDWLQERLHSYMSWNIKHRLIIWQFAIERYFEHPILGWGLDASRRLPGGNHSIPGVAGAEFMPLHPHNGFLQVWLELGVPGAILLALSLGSLARQQMVNLGGARLRLGAAIAASFVYVTQGTLSYGVWQNWWIAVALLSALHFTLTAPVSSLRPAP
jgi:exopolysaccharide production protein ExoQ